MSECKISIDPDSLQYFLNLKYVDVALLGLILTGMCCLRVSKKKLIFTGTCSSAVLLPCKSCWSLGAHHRTQLQVDRFGVGHVLFMLTPNLGSLIIWSPKWWYKWIATKR